MMRGELSPSARRILDALAAGPLTLDQLRVRVRPMSIAAILSCTRELTAYDLARTGHRVETAPRMVLELTDAGRELLHV
jgi:hypothetical protein